MPLFADSAIATMPRTDATPSSIEAPFIGMPFITTSAKASIRCRPRAGDEAELLELGFNQAAVGLADEARLRSGGHRRIRENKAGPKAETLRPKELKRTSIRPTK